MVMHNPTLSTQQNYTECLSIYTQLQQIEYTKEKGGVTHAVSA